MKIINLIYDFDNNIIKEIIGFIYVPIDVITIENKSYYFWEVEDEFSEFGEFIRRIYLRDII